MTYLNHMLRILRMDGTVYAELASTPLPMRYSLINVATLGLIYGLASIHFAETLLAGQTDAAIAFNPLMILMAGVSVAFFMHAGLALFVWVFCRGIGGRPQFMPTYLLIGTAAIALWPLAPAVSALQTGMAAPGLVTYACIATGYGVAVAFMAVKTASGLSIVKVTLAALATAGYVGCFLYLWL